jgi:tRNA U34 5-methylaminomethyl-2-thiouridine-forming methyltransferase MnmC
MNEIIRTGDGSHTIYVPELDEHYHSVYGAIRESEHIFIGSGFRTALADPLRIFEAGFGTGLNALLTCLDSSGSPRKVIYTSIEKYPLDKEIVKSLNYTDLLKGESQRIFEMIHGCQWNVPVEIDKNFTLLKLRGDLISEPISGKYDLIYFDAFGPDKQPELWSDEVISRVAGATDIGGIFVTYSVKGAVRRCLEKCGFKVSLLPGPPGKCHILRAVKS